MAQGDWTPDTAIRPQLINVTFDENGQVNHVGIGFDVILPSGAIAVSKGFTWTVPQAYAARLQAIMAALLQAAADDEGIANIRHMPRFGPNSHP